MEIQDIDNQILVKKTQLRFEKNSDKRQQLDKQIKALQMKKEIEVIKLKIVRLS